MIVGRVWTRGLVHSRASLAPAVRGVLGVIIVAQLGREQLDEHGGGGGVGPAVHLAALAGEGGGGRPGLVWPQVVGFTGWGSYVQAARSFIRIA